MIELRLERKYLKEEYTIGRLFVDGELFCDTLEDKVRDLNKDGDLQDPGEEKIPGKTAIPYGRYQVTVIYWPKHQRYVPWIMGVKEFTGILIHAGNIPEHTEGCVLVGENKLKGRLINSLLWERKLTEKLRNFIIGGHEIYILIV
jgi:hypothetical protein